jgi:hypothetical protein
MLAASAAATAELGGGERRWVEVFLAPPFYRWCCAGGSRGWQADEADAYPGGGPPRPAVDMAARWGLGAEVGLALLG